MLEENEASTSVVPTTTTSKAKRKKKKTKQSLRYKQQLEQLKAKALHRNFHDEVRLLRRAFLCTYKKYEKEKFLRKHKDQRKKHYAKQVAKLNEEIQKEKKNEDSLITKTESLKAYVKRQEEDCKGWKSDISALILKKTDLEQRLDEAHTESKRKEEDITALKKKNNELETYINKLNKEKEKDIKYMEKKNKELETYNDKLKKEKAALQLQIKEKDKALDVKSEENKNFVASARWRSEFVDANYTNNNPNIKDRSDEGKKVAEEFSELCNKNKKIDDLSDENRPTRLAEQFSELYENEWVDAFEVVDIGNEKEKTQFMLSILKKVKTFVHTKLMADFELLANQQKNIILEIRTVFERQLSEAFYTIGTDMIVKEFKIEKQDTVVNYVRKCMTICWSMYRHEPPLYLDFPEIEGDQPYDTNKFKYYTKAGKHLDFIVWPALYLHENGPMLAKGVAEGRN